MQHSWTAALLLAALGSLSSARPADPTLAEVVIRNFPAWDLNHDGVLTPSEVDQWVSDPAVKGQDAAAIATIKLAMRRKTDPIKKLSRDQIEQAAGGSQVQGAPEKEKEADGHGDLGEDDLGPRSAAELQKRYKAAVRKIEHRQAEAFTDTAPDIKSFHQGPLGDCYFVSMVGAMAHHEPDRLASLISVREDGSYVVKFAGAKEPAVVPPLTDAQVVIASTAGKDGLWLPIIENGYGELRKSTKPERADDEATDLIAKGGYAGETIELLTGHDATRLGLGGVPSKPLKDEELAQRAAKVRELLPDLLSRKRLVGVGTAKDAKLPPGVNPSHAYAVLEFDPATDTVTVWNPHGNTFKPKGEEGLANGYVTKGGIFHMQVPDLVRVFRGLVWETDKPAVPNAPRKKPAAKTTTT